MYTVYVYVLDTLADWELGHIVAELNSGRFFKKGAQSIALKTVSDSKEPIRTMGGMTIMPDCLVEDIAVNKESVLLALSLKKRGSSFRQALWYVQSVGQLLRWRAAACWMNVRIPAMGRDFLK